MFGARTRLTTGADLTAIRDIAPEQVNILVIDMGDLLRAEIAIFGTSIASSSTSVTHVLPSPLGRFKKQIVPIAEIFQVKSTRLGIV
jgi:hypothetical protein